MDVGDVDQPVMTDGEFDMFANARYSPSIGGWCQYRSLACTSQNSFLFYIVANVGPNNSHRPLAIALRQGDGAILGRVNHREVNENRVFHVLRDCVHLVKILSEPANRMVLEAELSLAAAWYNGDSFQDLERIEVPDVPQPSFDFSHCDIDFQRQEMPELPWAEGVREFPFISTCLRLGLNCNKSMSLHRVQEQTLGTMFRDDRLEYGMIVLDISDLDSVRYGIFGFEINYMAEVPLDVCLDWDPVEGSPPRVAPIALLEENRTRLPLSASSYMKKFSSFGFKDCLETLGGLSLVDEAALNYIWPEEAGNSYDERVSDEPQTTGIGELSIRLKRHEKSSTRPTPPDATTALDQTVENLVQDILYKGSLDSAKLDEYSNDPYFQDHLLRSLHRRPHDLSSSNSSTQLLRLVYAGRSHLNWVVYRNVSYESVAAAVGSEELSGAQALSLCIEELSGSPNVLFEALSRSDTLREICFLQSPEREKDTASCQLFAQLCASSYATSILQAKNVVLTCAYSAPLQKKLWLPYSSTRNNSNLVVDAFPVQHMFVRYQFADSAGRRNPKFWPVYFFLGDALLRPERFAVGFINYVCSLLTDRHLFSFAASPSSLVAYNQRSPGIAISPISAENFAIPGRCRVVTTTSTTTDMVDAPETQVECWPLVRVLQQNGWAILVSHEWYTDPKVHRGQWRPKWMEWGYDAEAPFLRYAFIRVRRRIEFSRANNAAASSERLLELVRPENVEVVGGLEEFLQQTAPDVDARLLDRPLKNVEQTIRGRWETKLPRGREYLSVLKESEARQILQDFLEDATFGRENLRRAMNAEPEGLLEERGSLQEMKRKNRAIFKSLLDPDVVNAEHPLGTEVRPFNERALYVLVTGATGFIGAHVVDSLLRRGLKVRGATRSLAKGEMMKAARPQYASQLDFVQIKDFSKLGVFDKAIDGIDAVIHVASPFTYNTTNNLTDLIQPAINGTTSILTASNLPTSRVSRIVLTSSFASIIDASNRPTSPSFTYTAAHWNPLTYAEATDPSTSPVIAYRGSKKFAELAAWDFMRKQSAPFDLVTLCPPMTFGPIAHPIPNGAAGLNESNAMLWSIAQGIDPLPVGRVSAWIDVRDLAEAHVEALLRTEAGGKRYVPASPEPFSYQFAADIMKEEFEWARGKVAKGDEEGRRPEAAYKLDGETVPRELGVGYRGFREAVVDVIGQVKGWEGA
ncbi:hypothetical protein AJ79_04291 [Helicocarpus griseus UAMH5409]|uniref:NAD-dependent epimerase/dehydratase domain-containing protein n=1 Tax=Helicocarpus griseus UAMH5409 TaxID=1447875 RepID=A0A2B7XU39_9EURO|nr:hypothetical protein AJ79_04291 [Helicocarpus griseus UAMH5409]